MTLARQLLEGPMNRAHSVYRYSSRPVIKQESVAEHTFFVMLYADMINASLGYEANSEKLLRRALIHDIDECVTGDFVRSFKYRNPELRREIQRASREFLQDMLKAYSVDTSVLLAAWDRGKSDNIEGDILRVADYMSVVAYLIRELQMGNGTMIDVYHECIEYGRNVKLVVLDDRLKAITEDAMNVLHEESLRYETDVVD